MNESSTVTERILDSYRQNLSEQRVPGSLFVGLVALLSIVACVFTYTSISGSPIGYVLSFYMIGFACVLPGLLIVHLLDLHCRPAEKALYTIGLSLLATTGLGVINTVFLPLVGVERPLSAVTLVTSLSLLVTGLAYIVSIRHSELQIPSIRIQNPQAILLLLGLPVASIVAAKTADLAENALPQMVVIALILAVILLVGEGTIPERLHPLAVYSISLSLLTTMTLYTSYLNGRDAHWEFFFAKKTLEAGLWQSDISFKAAVMLGISVLKPSLALISSLPLLSVYKYTSPLFFAFVPVGVYLLASRWTSSRVAFVGSGFMFSFWGFYLKLSHNYRQQMAMLYLIIFLLALAHVAERRRLDHQAFALLALASGVGVATSHYGMMFVLSFILGGVFVITSIVLAVNDLILRFENRPSVLPLSLLGAFAVTTYIWYSTIGNGILLSLLTNMGGSILLDLFTTTVSTGASKGGSSAAWLTRELYSISYQIFRVLNILLAPFVFIGFLSLIWTGLRNRSLEHLYQVAFAGAVGLVLLSMFLFPSANPIDLGRMFPVTLIWLGPIAALGLERAIYSLQNVTARLFAEQRLRDADGLSAERTITVLAFGLVISYAAFGTGFVPELTGEYQYSNALFKPSPDSDPALIVDNADIQAEDYASATWLGEHRRFESTVQADFTSIHLTAYAGVPRSEHWAPGSGVLGRYNPKSPSIPPQDYLYFRTIVYEYGIIPGNYGKAKFGENELYVDSESAIHKARSDYSKIYSTENTAVFQNLAR